MKAYSGRDEEFRERLGSYEDFVKSIPRSNPLRRLIGVKQFGTHGGLDPLEHTYNVLMLLTTDDFELEIERLTRPVSEILRVAVKYHDIGKLRGAFNILHSMHSAPIAEEILTRSEEYGEEEFTRDEIILIVKLILTHDMLGRLTQRFIPIELALEALTPPDGFDIKTEDMLSMHYRIAKADVASIPMLKDRVWQIERMYVVLKEEVSLEWHISKRRI
ncbi:MAG: hypothetical protein SVM80_06655 [Halobacteriota archaeon]|nr:hypothetical protein [Halobacteriota archaeon]